MLAGSRQKAQEQSQSYGVAVLAPLKMVPLSGRVSPSITDHLSAQMGHLN